MKALVTGGTGFIGSHIARMLHADGHSVRVLHRASSKLTALEGVAYESAIGDILDTAALRTACAGCDWVFHVAAVADYWRADRSKMFEANVEGTRRVLEAAREAGVGRVVFTSSAAAVGLRQGAPSDESCAFNLSPDQFPYGYSKNLAERVTAEAVLKGQDVVTVNPVIVMGPGDLNMISGDFVVQIKNYGRWTPVSPGGSSFVDVRDVARWHIAAAERGRAGERYILGTANYDYATWFRMIAETVGVGRPFLRVPRAVIPLVAFVVARLRRLGIKTPVDADQVRLSMLDVYFDYTKTWTELGQPQIDMQTSLRDTYSWYKANGYIE